MRAGRAERNPAEYLKEVLEPQEKGHFSALGADGLQKRQAVKRYSTERREAILRQMMPPADKLVSVLAPD